MNDIPIVYEDDALLIIDKPSGIAVNRSENEKFTTIQDWAQKRIKNLEHADNQEENSYYDRAGIVHRLDKDTSGLLIIAKKQQSFHLLQKEFTDKQVNKKYLALVHGKVQPVCGQIKAPLGRLPWQRRKFGVLPYGRQALTSYQVFQRFTYQNQDYSLLTVTPLTGRTHQIRIHLKYLGHSIVADKLYAGRKIYQQDTEFCPRLFLHAQSLEFTHPFSNRKISVESKLPAELTRVINLLTKEKNGNN